jgi:hypothetical protein
VDYTAGPEPHHGSPGERSVPQGPVHYRGHQVLWPLRRGVPLRRQENRHTPIRAPNAKPFCERWGGTFGLRVWTGPVVLCQRQLEGTLRTYTDHFNETRSPRGISLRTSMGDTSLIGDLGHRTFAGGPCSAVSKEPFGAVLRYRPGQEGASYAWFAPPDLLIEEGGQRRPLPQRGAASLGRPCRYAGEASGRAWSWTWLSRRCSLSGSSWGLWSWVSAGWLCSWACLATM